ncbi:MAG: 50S ribosomal protein L15 [Deltaproteobacteria bacterium]|jgi:large subunit ribosomal protein L15|nr:50S ribosomal protein L15 [Deltaproteobacteria bacterium]
MKLHELGPLPGSRHKRKRIGRGESSGQGKTAGRGHKGQKARSGGGTGPGFEGGQMPLQRRLPKRGFTNIFKKVFALVNVGDLASFAADSVLDQESFVAAGLVKNFRLPVKLLGTGEVERSLTVKVQAASAQAVEKIRGAGGQVEILTL